MTVLYDPNDDLTATLNTSDRDIDLVTVTGMELTFKDFHATHAETDTAIRQALGL